MLTSAFGFKDVPGNSCRSIAPFPTAAQFVTGIGFLGGGAIIFQNEVIRGLTTAASIWVVAAIGMAAARACTCSQESGTALTLIVLAALKKVENRWFKERRSSVLTLGRIDPSVMSLSQICAEVEGQGIKWSKLR